MANKGPTIVGYYKLKMAMDKVGNIPKKSIRPVAKKAMTISKKAAKKGGWIDQTGYLRKGIKLVQEKTKNKQKSVYQTTLDRNYNDVFQKHTSDGMVAEKKKGKPTGKRVKGHYYYPASQEYGFMAKNGRYIPGFHYLKKSLEEHKGEITNVIVTDMAKEIERLWRNGH